MNAKNGETFNPSGRIDYIDLTKGIAILLVILGHCSYTGFKNDIIKGMIFSFHMPLFFIVSAITYRSSEDTNEFREKTKKAAKHLLVPILLTVLILILWDLVKDITLLTNYDYWQGQIFSLIYGSGVNANFYGMDIAGLGKSWFLFALFGCRVIFDYINLCLNDKRKLMLFSMLFGLIGVLFGQIQWMPFSLDISLAVIPLFWFGYCLKKQVIEKNRIRNMLFWFVIWLITLKITFPNHNNWTFLELAARRYPLFPICYVTGIAGTMMVLEFCTLIYKLKIFGPLIYVRKNSMYLYIIHILDGIFVSWWKIESTMLGTALKRIIINLGIFLIFMMIKKIVEKNIMIRWSHNQ